MKNEEVNNDQIIRYYLFRTVNDFRARDFKLGLESAILKERRLNLFGETSGKSLHEINLDGFEVKEVKKENLNFRLNEFSEGKNYGFHAVIEGTERDFSALENYVALHSMEIESVRTAEGKNLDGICGEELETTKKKNFLVNKLSRFNTPYLNVVLAGVIFGMVFMKSSPPIYKKDNEVEKSDIQETQLIKENGREIAKARYSFVSGEDNESTLFDV